MNHQPIPRAIYEALPYFYILLGLVSLVWSANFLGQVSGGTLISAGLLIKHLRAQYRSALLLNRGSQRDELFSDD